MTMQKKFITPHERARLALLVKQIGSEMKLASLLRMHRITLWRLLTGRMALSSDFTDKINTLALIHGWDPNTGTVFFDDPHKEKKEWIREQIRIAKETKSRTDTETFFKDLKTHIESSRTVQTRKIEK